MNAFFLLLLLVLCFNEERKLRIYCRVFLHAATAIDIRNNFANVYLNYVLYLCVQELQLHLGVLQQHAALIGGPNATSCPICHKLFLGADALMEHMKHTHKDPNTNAGAASKYLILILCAGSQSENPHWFLNSDDAVAVIVHHEIKNQPTKQPQNGFCIRWRVEKIR